MSNWYVIQLYETTYEVIHDQMKRNQTIQEQTIRDQMISDQMIHDQLIHNQMIHDQLIQGQMIRNRNKMRWDKEEYKKVFDTQIQSQLSNPDSGPIVSQAANWNRNLQSTSQRGFSDYRHEPWRSLRNPKFTPPPLEYKNVLDAPTTNSINYSQSSSGQFFKSI